MKTMTTRSTLSSRLVPGWFRLAPSDHQMTPPAQTTTRRLLLLLLPFNLTQWTKAAVRTNLTGTVEWTDGAAGKHPYWFFRAFAP